MLCRPLRPSWKKKRAREFNQKERISVNDLAKFNMTDTAIATLANQYMPLAIKSVEDSEGYELVRNARLVVKSHRVAVEKVRVELKKDALEFGRKVDGEARRLTAMLEPIESHLAKEENAYNAAKEAIRNAARLKAEAEAKAVADAEAARLKAIADAEAAALKAAQDAENERLRIEREKLDAERAAMEAERATEAARLKEAQDKIDADRRVIEAEQKRLSDIEVARQREIDNERIRKEAAEKARIETEARIAREAIEEDQRLAAIDAAKAKAEALQPAHDQILAIAEKVNRIDVPSAKNRTEDEQVAFDSVVLVIDGAVEAIKKIAKSLVST